MKNQVNKKVSKLLIALLSLVIMSVACVSLAACNKECTHSKFKLSEDTATCVAGGFITHTCEDCGYAYMEPTPAKGHDYGTAEVVPATCTTDGYTVKTCKTCGFEEKSDATKATGHLHTSEVTVAATCIANGSKKVVCQDCGTVVSEETLLATGHAYVDEVVAATCGTDGYTLRTCTTCGDIQYVKGAPATGNHNYEEVSRIDATCKTAGTVLERCTVCDKEKTTLLPVSGVHTFGEMTNVAATCQEAAHREQTCQICGFVEKTDFTGDIAPHAWSLISETKATCTSKGVTVEECDYCGKKQITETEKLDHKYGEEATTVAATCETEGSKYYTCEICGHKDVTETYEKLGHDFSEVAAEVPATCTSAGFKTMMCARCGKNGATTVLNKLDHEYDEAKKVVVAATCTAGGYTLETCKLCGNQFTTETTEAAGHDWDMTRRTEATCTEDGQVLSTCKVCSATKIDVLEATGHQLTDMVKDATCTEGAMAYQLCTVCGATTAYVPVEGSEAIGHNFEVVLGATCQDNGYEVCANCGEEHTLDKIDHTYAIADSIYEKVDINVYFADGGKYAYLPEYAKENILAIFAAAQEAEKLNDYCTVTTATCTEGGSTQKICDMCKVRYTDGTTAALGHNFGDEMTVYEATCYSEGYIAWECTRCHYQAGASAAEIKTETEPMLAHEMTIGSGENEKKIYAKYVENVLTYFEDADCLTELTIAQCNVLAKVGDDKFVYYCDKCGAKADVNNKIATKTYATAGEAAFTGRYEKIDGVTLKVYATTEIMTEAGRLSSVDHVYALEGKIEPEQIIYCGYISRSYHSCTVCGGRDGDYAAYNLTEAKTTTESYKRPGTTDEDAEIFKLDATGTGHYEEYSYKMYYHKAVQVVKAPSCTEVEEYVYVCGRNAIDGVQAECAHYIDVTNATYDSVVASGKMLPKATEVPAETVDETETKTYTYTLVEKEDAPAHVIEMAQNYAATLSDEEKLEFEALEYYYLWDATFVCKNADGETVYCNTFATQFAAGHLFEKKYVIMSFDGEKTYSPKSCSAKYLIALDQCSKCGKYNYLNDGTESGIEATDLVRVTDENGTVTLVPAKETTGILVNTDNKLLNVKHGIAKVDEEGKLTWTNVLYKNAETNVACEATAEGAVAYAIRPDACGKDCELEHEHHYGCEDFTCATCGNEVYASHVYDLASTAVDCYHRQFCVLCGEMTKNYSHKEPVETCTDKWGYGDGYYHCEICAARLQKLTPHNVIVTVAKDSTCTELGAWKFHCTLCDKDITEDGALVKGLTANSDFMKQYGEEVNASVDEDTGANIFKSSWLVGAALKDHEWTSLEDAKTIEGFYQANTCTVDGFYIQKCKNCGGMKLATAENEVTTDKEAAKNVIKAPGHKYDEAEWTYASDDDKPTCVAGGTQYRVCDVCGEGKETKTVDALGHEIELVVDKSGKQDCVNGYPIAKDENGEFIFRCTRCDAISAKGITEEDAEGNKVPKTLIYQSDVINFLEGKQFLPATTTEGEVLDASGKTGVLYYTLGAHHYVYFDMENGHSEFEPGLWINPEGDKAGSAYWTCGNCDARVYRPGSVSLDDYNNPELNHSWYDKVANTIAKIEVTGVTLDFELTTEAYFTTTPAGFVLKTDKVNDLAAAIYAKLKGEGEDALTAPVLYIINGANVTLTFSEASAEADVALIVAAIKDYKYTTSLVIVNWKDEVAANIKAIEVEGMDLSLELTVAEYFDTTAEGFVLKTEKVNEIVEAIYAKATEGTPSEPATYVINGANVTLQFVNADDDKAAIKAAIESYKYMTSLTIELA